MPTLEVFTFAFLLQSAVATVPPNIIIIMADDLGWNDVSFHGSNQFLTPNIDALAYSGVILRDYYTQPICTPARAALLTGRHPIHNGMEDDVIYAPQPWGLPLQERLLSQELQERGYVTRAVGKWHLGFFRADYTPTRRGFHSHFGTWLGHQNHYTHMAYEPHPGYDFHDGLDVVWKAQNQLSADLFAEEAERVIATHNASQPLFLYLAHSAPHAPLQAPQSMVQKFSYIQSPRRQIFAAMVTQLDDCVGRVAEALKKKEMLENSIIVFITDNGGATNNFNGNVASNWPLRGGKDTLWEGGVRGVGLVWSPLVRVTPRVHHGMVNVQDLFPSLLAAINLTQDASELDGVNQWKALNNQSAAPYQTMLHNIDPIRGIAAIRNGDWKLVIGRTYNGNYDGWYGDLTESVSYDLQKIRDSTAGRALQTTTSPLPSDETILALRTQATVSCQPGSLNDGLREIPELQHFESFNKQDDCQPQISPCLFNIAEDPCEIHNLALVRPDLVAHMTSMLLTYRLTPPNNKPEDPSSYPEHWNNTWVPWRDYIRQKISVTMVNP